MNFKSSLPKEPGIENCTHSFNLWNRLEILGHKFVAVAFSAFPDSFNQGVVNNAGSIRWKDRLQVPLEIESCEGIKEST